VPEYSGAVNSRGGICRDVMMCSANELDAELAG
jgi:hypothetical protein